MKRLLCFILSVIFVFPLCSCNKASNKPKATLRGISFTAVVTKSGETHEYLVKIHKNGDCELLFTKDSAPTGVGLFFTSSKASAFLEGTDLEADIGIFPQALDGDLIYSVFSAAEGCPPKTENKTLFIRKDTGKYDFTLTLSGTGLPIKLTEMRREITCIFKNITID